MCLRMLREQPFYLIETNFTWKLRSDHFINQKKLRAWNSWFFWGDAVNLNGNILFFALQLEYVGMTLQVKKIHFSSPFGSPVGDLIWTKIAKNSKI